MKCYTKENNNIKIYEVRKDIMQLINLREEIIDDCSEITHESKQDIVIFPKLMSDLGEKRNLQATEIQVEGYVLPGEYHYDIEYDQYTYPYLVILINKLLTNKITESEFNFLLQPSQVNEKPVVSKQLENAKDIYMFMKESEELSDDAKMVLYEKIDTLRKLSELNEGQVSALDYYEYVISCLKFKLSDETQITNDMIRIEHPYKIKNLVK